MKSILNLEWLESRSEKMDSGCWHWIRHVNKTNGYGYCTVGGRPMPAHRVAYFIHNGEWPNHTRHTCDNRICVNPNHLLSGTNADNVRDKMERSGQPSGPDHGGSVSIDTGIVFAMKAAGYSNRVVAEAMNTSRGTIDRIVNGTHWSTRPGSGSKRERGCGGDPLPDRIVP